MGLSLARNLKLYPWYLSLTWEGLSNAVWYLYLFSFKGLSLGEMAWLVLLGDGVTVISEVPTGWIADRIGRRRSILLGIILQALSAVLFIFGNDFWTFWLAMAVCGLGDTFRSGADEALLYDSCRGLNRVPDYRRLLSRSMAIATVAMVAGQILGGMMATRISWTLPFWCELAVSTAGFLVVLSMLEAPHTDDVDDEEGPGSRVSLLPSLLRLLPLFIFAASIELAPELSHFHFPAELEQAIGLTPEQLGFMYAGFELLQGLGNWLAGHVSFRRPLMVLAGSSIAMLAGLLLLGTRSWAGLAVFIVGRALIDLMTGLAAPLISEEANRLTGSANRATVLSILNAASRLLPLSVLPLSASLIAASGPTKMYAVFAGAMLLPIVISLLWMFSLERRQAQA
ncbi:MAG: MFS transporter [Planctomycetales bacterium]|nr:MFS transporter [bacterium]UNM07324.1 MAG: MFS transporter [Planctomycetales bacterium]